MKSSITTNENINMHNYQSFLSANEHLNEIN